MNIATPIRADAFGLLLAIAASEPEVESFGFATLDFAPLIQARVPLTETDSLAVARALELRASLRLPFWDGAVLASSQLNPIPTGVLNAAAYHQKLEGKVEWIDTKQIDLLKLERLSQNALRSQRFLAITSSVQMLDGSIKHIPFLDLHLEYSDHATAVIADFIALLRSSGTLLRSGKSYHFYGDELLTFQELIAFLGRALLFAPIVDRAWIAHQLIEGRCALRISPRTEHGEIPAIICRV